jgi:hypothetical protein
MHPDDNQKDWVSTLEEEVSSNHAPVSITEHPKFEETMDRDALLRGYLRDVINRLTALETDNTTIRAELAQVRAKEHTEHVFSISDDTIRQIIEMCITEQRKRLGTRVMMPAD